MTPPAFRCPLCGGPHFLALGHDSITVRLYEAIEASLQDLGLGTPDRVERARLRLARTITLVDPHEDGWTNAVMEEADR